MRTPIDPAVWKTILALVLTIGGFGCGSGAISTSDAPGHDEAETILTKALDAWKAGQAAGLKSATPPIRLVDPDLANRNKLTAYSLAGEKNTVGASVDLPVDLTLQDTRGRTRQVRAVYQVTTVPEIAVLRNDP